MPPARPSIYTIVGMDREVRQGEIISNVTHHAFAIKSDGTDGFDTRKVGFVVAMTQDCDLLRDYDARRGGQSGVISGVLLYEAEHASAGRSRFGINTADWRKVSGHNMERFHLLRGSPPDCDLELVGIPDLLIDFRRHFTIRPEELERQISLDDGACRRCRIDTPYREHLQTRAAFYFQRVALPEADGPGA
jgi:hypothetical protein